MDVDMGMDMGMYLDMDDKDSNYWCNGNIWYANSKSTFIC
jgi:hypothetical protein